MSFFLEGNPVRMKGVRCGTGQTGRILQVDRDSWLTDRGFRLIFLFVLLWRSLGRKQVVRVCVLFGL